MTDLEMGLLEVLAQDPNHGLDLDRFDYKKAAFSKLEMVEAASGLHRKGLARRSSEDSDGCI
jgi:hypothetical protein